MRKGSFRYKILAVVAGFTLCSPIRAMDAQSDDSTNMNPNPIEQPTAKTVSEVHGVQPFGHWLFGGEFANAGFIGFSPDYIISSGDQIHVDLWGGMHASHLLEVDAKGNIFLPRVGPVKVSGMANKDLNNAIERAARTVYNEQVGVYAKIQSAQPVKVYVTGFIGKPGLYQGHSSDSPLKFLDMAGGINPDSGSFLNVVLKRGGEVLERYSLYDFLVTGKIVQRSIRDGDVLVVGPSAPRVVVKGMVDNPFSFELETSGESLGRVLELAGVKANATHIRLQSKLGTETNSVYTTIEKASSLKLSGGEKVHVLEDTKAQTFSVRVEGEHDSAKEVVVKDGMSLGTLLSSIEPTEWSDLDGIHLYRKSVQMRQKQMLQNSLASLEASVMTARSNTSEEAGLRQMEAQLIGSWVEKARLIEPKGQVILSSKDSYDQIMLEKGDVIVVPKRSAIVMIHGDVVSPVASAYRKGMSAQDYIELAGGFNQKASTSKVLVVSRNGAFKTYSGKDADDVEMYPGDEIMVVPSVATKSLQVSKDLTQIIYQIAVSAGTVLSLVL
ncbi:polysialic acid transporter [Vibrio parahaemolyticus]|nr:polysialic acid transporter [Vibrio parahaemolyticus]